MDAGVQFEGSLEPMPPVMVLEQLSTPSDRFDRLPEYATVRSEGAAWMREAPEDRAEVGRDLLALEDLLGDTLDPAGPSLVDMGIGAWDRVGGLLDQSEEQPGDDIERRMRRMLQPMTIEQLQEEDPVERLAAPEPDAATWSRAADLIEAIQRIHRHQGAGLSEGLRRGLDALHGRLQSQLNRARNHDATLDRRLDEASLSNDALPGMLRRRVTEYFAGGRFDADGVAVQVSSVSTGSNPYFEAIDAAVAEEQRQVDDVDLQTDALREVRQSAQSVAARILSQPEAETGELVAQLDTLFAREVALTEGQPWRKLPDGADVDTLALRKALAHLPRAATPQASGASTWAPQKHLPEVPVMGPDGQVIAVLRAGAQVSGNLVETADGRRLQIAHGDQQGLVDVRWLRGGQAKTEPGLPRPQAPRGAFKPAFTERSPQPLKAPPVPGTDMALAKAPARAPAPPKPALAKGRATGTVAAPSVSGPPLKIGRVSAQGLSGPDGERARPVLQRAMEHLEGRLTAKLAGDRALAQKLLTTEANITSVDVQITITVGGNVDSQAQAIADQIATRLIERARGAVS
ncbi:MAG: hypothetical protein ACE366_05655 [Bradymonadia bacterium]